MATLPTFFFSYARQDYDTLGIYMRKFYDDLHVRVAAAAGHDLSGGVLGTIDNRTELGADWDTRLSTALASSNILLAVISPLYFARPNCGREVGVFVVRSPELGLDPRGQLTGVRNVLIIRWMEPAFYDRNGEKDGRIPALIRRVNDMLPTPEIAAAHPDLADAIRFYRMNGMEMCVDKEPHYRRLLNALALAIVNASDLPPCQPLDWDDAVDAFRCDWSARLSTPLPTQLPPRAATLRPLTSAAIFYLTSRPFEADPVAAPFADQLVVEPTTDQTPGATDSELGALLLDMRDAAQSEGFQAVHCAPDPAVPLDATAVIARLRALSGRHVLTALAIDPVLIMGRALPVLREIVDDDTWTGPVLIPMFTDAPSNTDAILDPARRMLYQLPEARDTRKTMLVSILLNLRRQVTASARAARPTVAEPMPLLRGAGGSR